MYLKTLDDERIGSCKSLSSEFLIRFPSFGIRCIHDSEKPILVIPLTLYIA